jgi:hypothetical protein
VSSQLLEVLLDLNSSGQIPSHHRFDLALETPGLSAVPSLVDDDEDLLREIKRDTPESIALYDEIKAMIDRKLEAKSGSGPSKSLTQLLTTIPHRTSAQGVPMNLVHDLTDTALDQPPVSYIPVDRIDDYLQDIDEALGTASHASEIRIEKEPSSTLTDKELAVRNPNSVYNWLRQHEPKIFLQDGEGSEKSTGKPGALRGAGKRTSIPAPSRPDQVEFVEEDGIGYDITLSNSAIKGKRKRDEDAGYRPKGGSSRASKKRKSDASVSLGAGTGSTRRVRASNPSNAPGSPQAHDAPYDPTSL